jgi:hypothetical protein
MTQRLRFCFAAGFLGAFVQETKDLVKGCNSDGADEEKVGTLPDCSAGLLHQARCFYYVYIYIILSKEVGKQYFRVTNDFYLMKFTMMKGGT